LNSLLKQKDILGFGALAIIIIILPLFVESKYYFIVLNVIGLNTIVVVGLNLFIGFAGQISLGHAAFYGLGSYFSGVLTVNYGFPLWPAMLVGMLATGAIAYLIGYPGRAGAVHRWARRFDGYTSSHNWWIGL
jgi:branched-chain amino acid transport system permease protein